ncbi:MAG: hypothetical protein LBI59_11320 [Candidatus Accumulibacter sp.]|nr:hypothetical protein [Accumulibacter sp.]
MKRLCPVSRRLTPNRVKAPSPRSNAWPSSKLWRKNNGNKTRAAKILGISREGLRKKLKRMEIA